MLRDQAIVVGIGSYPRFGADGTSANDLPGAVADANAMADWLANSAGAEVTLITSDTNRGQPWNVANIRPRPDDIYEAFEPFVTSKTPQVARRLYVYVAGHGIAPERRSRCLVTANAVGTDWVHNLEVPFLLDWFANRYHFDELVLWMDCCATLTLDYTRGRPAGLPNTVQRSGPLARMFMAFGSGAGRPAYEGPIGPNGTIRGKFTYELLRGLKGAAVNQQTGELRSLDLARFLQNMEPISGAGVNPQIQTSASPHVLESDDMLFPVANVPTYRIRANLDAGALSADGTVLTLTSMETFTRTAVVASGWVQFSLGLGLYKLSGPNGSRLIEISAGTPSDIA